MKEHYTVLIVGSGPAGLAAAFWMKKNVPAYIPNPVSVAIVDKTRYPSGGLINDGKMNLTPFIGMDDYTDNRIDLPTAWEHIHFFDEILVRHGANPELTGIDERVVGVWRDRLATHGLELVTETRQRHIGTDRSKQVINSMREELQGAGIEFELGQGVTEIIPRQDGLFEVSLEREGIPGTITCDYLLLSPGRSGSQWFRNQLDTLDIPYSLSPIEVGVRIEMLRTDYPIAEVIRDPKIKMTAENGDRVKTFCTNPGGKIRFDMPEQALHYKGRTLTMINGDGRRNSSTPNTNFAILNKIGLVEPEGDTEAYALDLIVKTFRAGGWKPIVQRLGRFLDYRRSKPGHFGNGERVQPTLPVVRTDGSIGVVMPGDINIVYPARTVHNIRDILMRLGQDMPGVMHPDNLLYAPEIKFQSVKVDVSGTLETKIPHFYVAGNGAGLSSGIVGAASNGILAAKGILGHLYPA
ncbi:hypothetical protein HYU19_03270 [Candidatus Woesearchaeota archaeon]|nr:hypothetical protein [Candidatus Woesearchaeota archaeon]